MASELAGKGTVVSLNVSQGGVPKLPVAEAQVTRLGMEGDRQANPNVHGGPERALCLFSADLIAALQAEGHPIAPGTTGENVTIAGLDWAEVAPGTRWRLGGEVEIEITQPTTPCKTIAASFAGGDFNRIHHARFPGWSRVYARVLREGVVRTGDPVTRVEAERG
ncbi:MOSC domain-containing protein [Tepidiforma thermophila]|uniref:MOSC domain-containing protein YiiM n=1 Tax=Tepidiforma thermophila (strain KCTC 52669 / CGMCC 1.13589 / G233) TaxID=2761530 RepID=A0A2A9HC67_TEPT2|nr:MOSC domain-containing protein [Tepidiforma thermophila]PFG72923.1 MOSC domain-containing protein YiiM [Tepidiforma thermophila]